MLYCCRSADFAAVDNAVSLKPFTHLKQNKEDAKKKHLFHIYFMKLYIFGRLQSTLLRTTYSSLAHYVIF